MVRKCFSVILLILSLSLLVGCYYPNFVDDSSSIKYSYFQKRFDDLPVGITASDWQSKPQDNGGTVYSTVLTCDDNQYDHTLVVITNSEGRIADIRLQNKKADSDDSCFAMISFHVFCSMGFNDKDGKGNIVYSDPSRFYAYFQSTSGEDEQKRIIWINGHQVDYTYQSDSGTQSFTIHNKEA